MYSLKDISVIIATYNRPESLEIALKSLDRGVREIIIIDQSTDNLTLKVVKKFKRINLKYFYFEIPSLPAARNLGIKKVSKNSKIVIFFDDDITLGKNYFNKILEVFNKFESVKGVGAYYRIPKEKVKWGFAESFVRKIFFLEHFEKDRMRVISAYGKTYPLALGKIIQSQWIPGVNMAYKKEIFDEIKFDENFGGYALAEDLDFSYRLFKRYPDSLFITPFANFIHRSNENREVNEKSAFMNQINHFYFNYKNLDETRKQKIVFIWSLFGLILLRILRFLGGFKRNDWRKLKFFIKSLNYCLENLDRIKKGKLSYQKNNGAPHLKRCGL